MIVQFVQGKNIIKVYKDRKSGSPLIVIPNAVRSHANAALGFKARASDWTKTSWGSEIELTLTPKKK